MEKFVLIYSGITILCLIVLHVAEIILIQKTRKEVSQYIHYVEKFEHEKPVEIRYLVFGSSYRECETRWVNSKYSAGLPKTAAKFVTYDNCPADIQGYWNDVHFKRVTLIGITQREFDKLYYKY